jgi:hypothetical protein
MHVSQSGVELLVKCEFAICCTAVITLTRPTSAATITLVRLASVSSTFVGVTAVVCYCTSSHLVVIVGIFF